MKVKMRKMSVTPIYKCKNCGKKYEIQAWSKEYLCEFLEGCEDDDIESAAFIDDHKPHRVYHNCGDAEYGIAKMVGFVRRVVDD